MKSSKVAPTPFKKFDTLFRAVISAPKSAVDREELETRRRKREQRSRLPVTPT